MKPPIARSQDPAAPPAVERIAELQAEIRDLADQRHAIVLAHAFQPPEIQDVADHVGDSLELAQRAAASGAEVIGFCGVHYMAETVSILAPNRTFCFRTSRRAVRSRNPSTPRSCAAG
jgi:quinolinate synthase